MPIRLCIGDTILLKYKDRTDKPSREYVGIIRYIGYIAGFFYTPKNTFHIFFLNCAFAGYKNCCVFVCVCLQTIWNAPCALKKCFWHIVLSQWFTTLLCFVKCFLFVLKCTKYSVNKNVLKTEKKKKAYFAKPRIMTCDMYTHFWNLHCFFFRELTQINEPLCKKNKKKTHKIAPKKKQKTKIKS